MTNVLSQRGLNRPRWLASTAGPRARTGDRGDRAPGRDAIPDAARPVRGLWTRLQDFAPDELSALTEERQVVRLHLMRNTVHLVSVRDCLDLDWRALFYPLHATEFSAHFRRGTEGVDRDALLRQAMRLLEEQPRTRSEFGKLLAEYWPDADPSALAYAATHHSALCQS